MLGLAALGGGWLVNGRTAPAPEVAAAIALYDEDNYSAAKTRFDEIARSRPDDPEVDLYRGRLALWFDDAAVGLAFLQKAVQVAPDDARMQNAFGDACGLTARRLAVVPASLCTLTRKGRHPFSRSSGRAGPGDTWTRISGLMPTATRQ